MSLAVLDIVMLVIVLVSSIIGIFSGFIKEAISLAAWFASFFIASLFSPLLSDYIVNLISNDSVRTIAAFAILFISVKVVGTILANLLAKLSSAAGLGGLDRSLGALFGLFRGVLIVLLLVFLTRSLEFTQPWYQESLFAPYALDSITYLETFFN